MSALCRLPDDEALGSEEEKPMGREASARLRASFLLGLEGTLRIDPSASLTINVERLDSDRVFPYESPMLGSCCAEGYPIIHPIVVDNEAKSVLPSDDESEG